MPLVTREMLPPSEEKAAPRKARVAGAARRLVPRASIPASRAAIIAALTLVAAAAPDLWLRAIAVAIVLLVAYLAGWLDGRRALSVEIVRDRLPTRGA